MNDLEKLYERIEKGIAWCTEHDPTGRFHLWYESKILPSSPKPAQDEASKAGYAEYYRGRLQFEQLWRAMEREEKRRAVP